MVFIVENVQNTLLRYFNPSNVCKDFFFLNRLICVCVKDKGPNRSSRKVRVSLPALSAPVRLYKLNNLLPPDGHLSDSHSDVWWKDLTVCFPKPSEVPVRIPEVHQHTNNEKQHQTPEKKTCLFLHQLVSNFVCVLFGAGQVV